MSTDAEVRETTREATQTALLIERFADTVAEVKGLELDGSSGESIIRFGHGVDLRVTVSVEVES